MNLTRFTPMTADQPPAAGAVTRREGALLGIILVAGMVLRLLALSHSAVEHFDEGVYASNIYFGPPEYAYPLQRFYAPPLLPALIETGMMAGLDPNLAALLPSFLAGCGTIVALWWCGRSWFGPPVGIAAAALAALSDFHIAYSAAALTDVLLGLWLLLAVDAIGRSFVAGDLRWATGAGLYTGLAWWTKYNGWLPLAIEAVTLPLLWLFIRPPQRQLFTWLGCFAVTVIVACAVWSPYYFPLQSQGGYAPIAANHAKYIVGFAGWFHSAGQQIAAQYVMEGPVTWLGAGLAGALAVAMQDSAGQAQQTHRGRTNAILVGVCFFLVLACLSFAGSSVVVAGIAALMGLFLSFRSWWTKPVHEFVSTRVGIWLVLLGGWWGALLLATPCYWPYPRLILPWLIVSWLGTAIAWSQLAGGIMPHAAESVSAPTRHGLAPLAFVALACLVAAIATRVMLLPLHHRSEMGRDRRGTAKIAQEIRKIIGPAADNSTAESQPPRAIYVFGEPALYFQLKAAGEEFVGPVENIPTQPATLDGRPAATYFLAGPHAFRDPQFQQQWASAEDRWELVKSCAYSPSFMVWLDLYNPNQPDAPDSKSQNQVRLYRLRR